MQHVKLHDKNFSLFIREKEIQEAISAVAKKISIDLVDKKPLFLGVLNGSFLFAADLLKQLSFDCEISFIKVASYEGTTSSGEIKSLIGLNENIKGRTVVIVEDIVDTGSTIEKIVTDLKKMEPAGIKIATLLLKPDVYKKNIPLDYVAMEVANDFLVGYGLDYDGLGRNLKDIYKISS